MILASEFEKKLLIEDFLQAYNYYTDGVQNLNNNNFISYRFIISIIDNLI